MCNGLSSFAEATALSCPGTRAIKSQTRASGAEARRRRGRGRARSAQRDGAGARLHAAVRPADPGGAAQEGGARTICSATRVRSRKPSTRLPRGLPAALSHPSPPTSASIAAPAAMDARGRRRPRASAAQAAPVFPSLADGQQSGLPAILQHGMAFERASDRVKGQGPRAGESLRRRVPECLPGYMYWKPEVGAV